MAEKAKQKNNKNLIIGICTGVLLIAVVVIIVIFTIPKNPKLDENFFKTSDTQFVMTMDGSEFETEDTTIKPVKAYVIYRHNDKNITGASTYIEFTNASTAKKALDMLKSQNELKDEAKSFSVNDKYVVIEMDESTYEGLTVEHLKFYESLESGDYNIDEPEKSYEEEE